MSASVPNVVYLRMPCKAEYVGVARLAILGVASRMAFSYDEVEDLRLAVGEACAASVDRSDKNGLCDTEIAITCTVGDRQLLVEIVDSAGPAADTTDASLTEPDAQAIAGLLISLLVDEVEVTPVGKGTRLSIVKHTPHTHAIQ